MDESEGCWVEIRPLLTSSIKPSNFIPLLDSLHNSFKPLRFLAVDAEDPNIEGKHLVRFFIQLPNKNMMEQMMNVVRASLDVEIVDAEPPKKKYQRCVDLELARHYAIPVCHFKEKPVMNLIDRIVAALGGSGAALEIVACGDPKAAVGIQKWIYDRTQRGPSMSKALSDIGVGVVAEATVQRYPKDISREAWWKTGRQYKSDSWARKEVEESEMKLHRSLFTCNVRIYGDSPEMIQAVKDALPSAMNRFRVFKTEREPVEVEMKLEKPSKHWFRNNLLCRLWMVVPVATLFLSWFLGFFDPVRMIFSSSSTSTDMTVLAVAMLSAFLFYLFFRKRNPIILSDEELSQIVGLPSAVGKLPVALGSLTMTRMQLGGAEWAEPSNPEEKKETEHSERSVKTEGQTESEGGKKEEKVRPVMGWLPSG